MLAQLSHLRTHEPVAAGVARGALQIHGWVWDIGGGRVRAFDGDVGAFVDVLDRDAAR